MRSPLALVAAPPALDPTCWAAVAAELGQRAAAEVPRAVRRRGLVGTTQLAFRVAVDGGVDQAKVERSSGHALLDEAALALVVRPLARRGCQGDGRWAVEFKARLEE